MQLPSDNEYQVNDLLDFCLSSALISGYDRQKAGISIRTGIGRWTLSTEEAALFLLGALKYRPDLRYAWDVRARRARTGLAA